MELQGKKVLVVGLGPKTGVSAVKLLATLGAVVTAVDGKKREQLQVSLQQLEGVQFDLICGGMEPEIVDAFELVLLSPGVPPTLPLLVRAKEHDIPVIGDIELAYQLLPNKFIGITGTDGKSTTTSMVGAILKNAEAGLIAGNIGYPVLNLVSEVAPEQIVALELSSFQLESITSFKPHVGAILNLAPDHLDRYPDMKSYLDAKLRLFSNFDSDCVAVLPKDDAAFDEMAAAVPAGVPKLTFSMSDKAADFYIFDEQLYHKETSFLNVRELHVVGQHNWLNALAASAICYAVGIELSLLSAGLLTYRGLAHRFEYAGCVGDVTFINDSKATTVSAVSTAIESADEGACIMMGGRDKGLDFAPLKERLDAKKLQVFSFGEAAEKISNALELDAKLYPDMESAQRAAWEIAANNGGGQVVLAPGCTSYDEFVNFEVRGEKFKSLVAQFKEEAANRE